MYFLKQVRIKNIELSTELRKKKWLFYFVQSYLVVFISYMCMYLIRKNYNISQNDLIEKFHFTKTDLGTIGLYFSITYGLGKSIVGYIGDGRNTKNFVAFLLILSAFCMFGFGLSLGSIPLMALFYAMNGFFQSAGGPLSYSTISKWTPQKIRGTFLGIWNMSHNVGGALAAIVATYGAEVVFEGDLKGMFFFPASIALVVGILGFYFGSDSPETYGLGKSEEIFNEELSKEDLHEQKLNLSKWQVFVSYILKNPYMWLLAFSNVFVYVIRIGVDQWGIVYAKEVMGLSKEVAKMGFTMFEVGALSGALIWGGFSDLLKGRRAALCMVALALIFFTLEIYQHAQSEFVYRWAMFALGFLIFGPQLLIGVSAVFFVPKNAVSIGNGVLGTMAYIIGDSFAKIGLGMMADHKTVFFLTGWDGTFKAMYISSILGIIFLFFVAVKEERRIRHKD